MDFKVRSQPDVQLADEPDVDPVPLFKGIGANRRCDVAIDWLWAEQTCGVIRATLRISPKSRCCAAHKNRV